MAANGHYASSWYKDTGHALIQEHAEKYRGLGLGIWLSNLDLVPYGIEYRQLQGLITNCPCRYVEEYDDIVLYV